MKVAWHFCAASFILIALSSCEPPPGEAYVRQKIPIEIQCGVTISLKIYTSGGDSNNIGIRCTPEVWSALNNGSKTITAQLSSFNEKSTEIRVVENGQAYGFVYTAPNAHYLFDVYGKRDATALVEVIFPNAPPGITHAEIFVFKTPSDTGL